MAQQAAQPLLRGHPHGIPGHSARLAPQRAPKTKTKVFPARCVGVRQQNRSQDQHEPPPVTTPGPTQGRRAPAPGGSPSAPPARLQPAPARGGGTPTARRDGEANGGVTRASLPDPRQRGGPARPPIHPHSPPSPPPPLTVLRWGLGSGCGCGSGGCIPAPRLCPGPRCGGPPAPPEEGERQRRVARRAGGRGERRLEQGAGPGAERGREALPGSVRGAGAAGRGGAPAAPNGVRHGAARARRTARLSRDLAEAAAAGEGGAGARRRAAASEGGGERAGMGAGSGPRGGARVSWRGCALGLPLIPILAWRPPLLSAFKRNFPLAGTEHSAACWSWLGTLAPGFPPPPQRSLSVVGQELRCYFLSVGSSDEVRAHSGYTVHRMGPVGSRWVIRPSLSAPAGPHRAQARGCVQTVLEWLQWGRLHALHGRSVPVHVLTWHRIAVSRKTLLCSYPNVSWSCASPSNIFGPSVWRMDSGLL